jgi:hypothetical protein
MIRYVGSVPPNDAMQHENNAPTRTPTQHGDLRQSVRRLAPITLTGDRSRYSRYARVLSFEERPACAQYSLSEGL